MKDDAGVNSRIVFCRSNPVAPDPRVEKETAVLERAGYRVQIVAWDRSGALPPTEQIAGGTVTRLAIRADYASGLNNLPALLRWQAKLLGWLVQRRNSYDVIHACDFDTIFPALVCKLLFGKRVIYDIFDFYADHLRLTPDPLKRLIRFLDLRAIGWADAIILVDEARWEQIRGARPRASAVIYNSPADLPEPAHQAEVVGDKNCLRIAYIGLLQMERGLFEMLDVLEKRPEWHLDLAGFGGDEAALVERAEHMPNVHWHGRVPYEHALALSAAADILFATYDPRIPNHRYSSANKIFEAMMLGKPVITARGTNMDRMIEQADCGLVVPYGDVPALEAALEQLNDPELRQRLGQNARQAYETHYGWHIMQERLLALYAALGATPPKA